MAEDEVQDEVVEEGQASTDKSYVTAVFNKTEDADILRQYNLVRNVGGFSARDIVEAGIQAAWTSDAMAKAAALLKKDFK